MKFPKRVRHKGQVVTIYGKSKSYPGYRVAWHVAGQRKLERFRTYGEAKRRADALVTQLAKGSNVTALSAKQVEGRVGRDSGAMEATLKSIGR